MKLVQKTIAVIAISVMACVGMAHAVVFDLTYDDTPTGAIDSTLVGTGTFSYDGPAVAGSFLLSDLSGVSFNAVVGGVSFSGPPFDPADSSLIGIDVTDVGSGMFELIFTGESATTNGSLDIVLPAAILTHQPAILLGGSPGPNLYGSSGPGFSFFGDYLAKSTVPIPSVLPLLALGVAALGFQRRRTA